MQPLTDRMPLLPLCQTQGQGQSRSRSHTGEGYAITQWLLCQPVIAMSPPYDQTDTSPNNQSTGPLPGQVIQGHGGLYESPSLDLAPKAAQESSGTQEDSTLLSATSDSIHRGFDINPLLVDQEQAYLSPVFNDVITDNSSVLLRDHGSPLWPTMDMIDPMLENHVFHQQNQTFDPWPPQGQSPGLTLPLLQHSSSSRSTGPSVSTPTTSIDNDDLDADAGTRRTPHTNARPVAPFSTTIEFAQTSQQPPQPVQSSTRSKRSHNILPISTTAPDPSNPTTSNSAISPSLLEQPRTQSLPGDAAAAASPSPLPRTSASSSPRKSSNPTRKVRNRAAASRCRARNSDKEKNLEEEERAARARNEALRRSVTLLREEMLTLRTEVLQQATCDCALLKGYLATKAEQIVKEDHEFGCVLMKARAEAQAQEDEGVHDDEDDEVEDDAGIEDKGKRKQGVARRRKSVVEKGEGRTPRRVTAEDGLTEIGAWGTENVPLVIDFSRSGPGQTK